MPKKIPPKTQELLNNAEWLTDMHVRQLFSIVELSKMLKVTPALVTKFLRKNEIHSPTQQALREASNKRKYGVSNPGAVNEFRQKALNTMVQKFGGHVWATGTTTKQRRDETCIQKYGSVNVGGTEYSKHKAKQTNLEKYGRSHVNQSHILPEVLKCIDSRDWLYDQHIIQKKSLTQIAAECGLSDMTIIMNRLRKFGIETQQFQSSYQEKQITEFISSLGITDIVTNTRKVIGPKELDIYLPEYKIAIEYCGLYWHSEQQGKTRTYHRDKLVDCNKKGIRLLTIFDHEWNTKTECVKTKLSHILNKQQTKSIFARKCKIEMVSKTHKVLFFNMHHIQGDGPSSINIGLYSNNICVAVIGFIEKSHGVFILNRYATSKLIPGGFSKLLSFFKRTYKWSKIITFADQRWSEGSLYQHTGFKVETITAPEYYYIINNEPKHKFSFRHKQLKNKLKNYDKQLSEWENCKLNNITRIWDCGKIKYTLTNNDY
jgi:very-short-patch-repair endonuclease